MNTATSQWLILLDNILENGNDVNPRGIGTKEIMGYSSCIDMTHPVVSVKNRKLNYKFLCGEAFWILSGSNFVKDIVPFMKNIAAFSDNGIHFNGAYGPKVVDQLQYVCESFQHDHESRQAIINIWRENPRVSKDIPCTLSLQFLIRNNQLNCIATMRSSDAWLGWVYDVFNFSMISAWIVIYLRTQSDQAVFRDLQLGNLLLTAGSQHLYSKDWDKATSIADGYHIDKFECHDIQPFKVEYYNHPDVLLEDLRYTGLNEGIVTNNFFTIKQVIADG